MLYYAEDKILTVERQIGDSKDLLERVVRELRTEFRDMVARVKYEKIPPVYRKGVRVYFWSSKQAEAAETWIEKHFKKK